MILDALYHNRAYACESGQVLLDFTVNGQPMASTLPETLDYHFRVGIELLHKATGSEDKEAADAFPVLCQVISDYGKTVAEVQTTVGKDLEFDIESQTARYFYLRLVDAKGRKTWSAPIWTGRAADPISLEAPGELIKKTDFQAVDLVTRLNAGNVICDDIQLAYESDRTTAEIRIDMGQEYEICALSHIALKTYRALLTQQGVTEQEEFSRYVKFEVINTVGAACGWKQHANASVKLGELSVYGVLR